MRLWSLTTRDEQPRSAKPQALRDDAMAAVIGCIGRDDFGTAALAGLNGALAVDSWSVYRVAAHRPPCLYASGSYRVPDATRACFDLYRQHLHGADTSFERIRAHAPLTTPVLAHWRAEEMPASHREQIYVRHGMRERLSLVGTDGGEGLLTVNLYRHVEHPPFGDADFDAAWHAAGWLFASVRRHVALTSPAAPDTACDAAAMLLGRCPALTPRELQVCDRLLRGWTHDGIACDLALSVATVKTYRNRAFDRLGIHFRSELFGLAMGRAAQQH